MRKSMVVLSVAAGLAACVGGAMRPSPVPSRADCRAASEQVKWIVVAAEAAAQDAWCAAVGAPLVLTAPAVETHLLDSIAVVSWNVKVGGGDVRRLVTQLRRGVLTGGNRVEHFVILLQEAHRAGDAVPQRLSGMRVPRGIAAKPANGTRSSIDDVARELGLSLAYVPSMRNGDVATTGAAEDRGSAVLSTLPLRDVHAIELPLARQRRVVVAATLDARTAGGSDWSLQVSSVHLENRPARGVTGVTERDEQMQHLLSVLPPAELSLLGGDLNTWTRGQAEPAVARALAEHPETAAAPLHPTYDGPAFLDMNLDYLFARLPGGHMSGYVRADDRFGSDHYPLLAWVHPHQ